MIILGIDIGGTSVKTALLRDGALLRTSRSDAYAMPGRDELRRAIGQAGSAALGNENISAVGVCCPGLLDRQRGMITLSVNVPGLVGVRMEELLGEALGAERIPGPPAIVSDANATALDLYDSRKLSGRLLCLCIGTGVGAAVIDGQARAEGGLRLLRVAGESAGHLGQIDVSLMGDAPIGPDGGRGSLEAYLGAAALRARYGDENPTERLAVDDPPMRALVRAIRIAHAIYRPDHVALAGGIGIRLGRLVDGLQRRINTDLTSVARKEWTLSCGDSDDHAAIGAARWVEMANSPAGMGS